MSKRIETICVQGGYDPKNGEPRQIEFKEVDCRAPLDGKTIFTCDKRQDFRYKMDLLHVLPKHQISLHGLTTTLYFRSSDPPLSIMRQPEPRSSRTRWAVK